MVGRGVSRLEATWTKLEIWGETGDKRPSKWTREPVWVGAEIMWKRGAEGVPAGAGGALSSQSFHRPSILVFGQPTMSAINPSCVCEPPSQFFICELWELDSM